MAIATKTLREPMPLSSFRHKLNRESDVAVANSIFDRVSRAEQLRDDIGPYGQCPSPAFLDALDVALLRSVHSIGKYRSGRPALSAVSSAAESLLAVYLALECQFRWRQPISESDLSFYRGESATAGEAQLWRPRPKWSHTAFVERFDKLIELHQRFTNPGGPDLPDGELPASFSFLKLDGYLPNKKLWETMLPGIYERVSLFTPAEVARR